MLPLTPILGCILTNPGNFTGTAGAVTCDVTVNYNTGCGIVDQSIASFGETFNEKGGGVYAMKWDEFSIDALVRDNVERRIRVGFFYRSAIPDDILDGLPNPANWRLPSASLSHIGCPMNKYFKNQMIIFGLSSLLPIPLLSADNFDRHNPLW